LVYDDVNELVISGTYNSDVLGSYEISYYVENPLGVKSPTIVRTIEVVDTTNPTFVLPDSLTIEAGTAINYQSLFIGYASDLSNSIVISTPAVIDNKETGTTNIRLRATDSSGNYTEDTIDIIIVDTTKPTFNISNQSINEDEFDNIDWSTYVTAMSDNSNSVLTVTVTDNVNYTESGTYSNTVRVTDESGNYLEKTFTVEVVEVVIEYKVRFLKEDGVTLIQEFTVSEGEKVASITYEISGYEFEHWLYENEEFDFNTPITEDIDLIAKVVEVEEPVKDPLVGCIRGIFGSIYLDAGLLVVFSLGVFARKKEWI
jgi:hypothetical protein